MKKKNGQLRTHGLVHVRFGGYNRLWLVKRVGVNPITVGK